MVELSFGLFDFGLVYADPSLMWVAMYHWFPSACLTPSMVSAGQICRGELGILWLCTTRRRRPALRGASSANGPNESFRSFYAVDKFVGIGGRFHDRVVGDADNFSVGAESTKLFNRFSS
jgi:hypothetical protein